VHETGAIETPVILTNTLSVGTAAAALVRYILGLPGNEDVQSVNPVVGEINDGYLNDIRGMHVTEADLFDSIRSGNSGRSPRETSAAGPGRAHLGSKPGSARHHGSFPARTIGGTRSACWCNRISAGTLTSSALPWGANCRCHRTLTVAGRRRDHA
jgi:D-aminopeptidase